MEQKTKRKRKASLSDDLTKTDQREIKPKITDLPQELLTQGEKKTRQEVTDLLEEPSLMASFEELFNNVISREVALREKKDSNEANPKETEQWYNLRDRIADWLEFVRSILKDQGITSEEIAAAGAQDKQAEFCFNHMMELSNKGLVQDCGRFALVGKTLVRDSSANSHTSEISIKTQSTNPEEVEKTYEYFKNLPPQVSFEGGQATDLSAEGSELSQDDPPEFNFDIPSGAPLHTTKEESKFTGFGRILHQLNSSSSLAPNSNIQQKEVNSPVGPEEPPGNLITSKQEVLPIEQQRTTRIDPHLSFVSNLRIENLVNENQAILSPSGLGTLGTDEPSPSPTKQ